MQPTIKAVPMQVSIPYSTIKSINTCPMIIFPKVSIPYSTIKSLILKNKFMLGTNRLSNANIQNNAQKYVDL